MFGFFPLVASLRVDSPSIRVFIFKEMVTHKDNDLVLLFFHFNYLFLACIEILSFSALKLRMKTG